jgi:flagellar hook-associated protein 3 FlgL
MISNLDPGSELFIANVDRIQQSIATASRQISSGKKISVASDAPDQIGSLLQLRASLQHNGQIQSNLALAKSNADSADTALSSAIKLMDQALVLGEQGANSTQTADVRQNLAQQVQSIQERMVATSQTTDQGHYIFSGDQIGRPAYVFDPTLLATNPVVQQSAVAATSRVEDPAGGSFAAAKSAQEIFDSQNTTGPAPDNVFTALNNLRLALLGGDPVTITNSLDPLKQASTHLNSMEASYGLVQNRIQDATDFASNRDTQLRTQISQTEDADITSAALELTQASTQLQAAFQMRAKLPHTSLFDYLA